MTQKLGKLYIKSNDTNVEKRPPFTLETNEIYDGEWDKTTNVRSGVGRLIFHDGSVYEGKFANDKANGYGRHIRVNGEYYIG